MKAVHVTHFAEADNVAFTHDAPKPTLDPASNDLLIRVLACGLNTGDCLNMRGAASLFVKPKIFPYIPGMDVCGVVEAVGQQCTSFAKGDRVAVALGPIERHGGLAEYLVCVATQATLAPSQLTPIQVAALPISGTTAVQAVADAKVGPGSRIIVLGASGGVGSLVVQVAKAAGASFVAATSTNTALVTSLGADLVIDYRMTQWWDVVDGHLDAIIDCVGCDDSWANCSRVLARNGRYIAVSNTQEPSIRSVGEFLGFVGGVLGRVLNPFSPTYKMVVSFPTSKEVETVMELARDGKIHAVLDPLSPCAFDLAGVEKAVALQKSHRAKGKVVFEISLA